MEPTGRVREVAVTELRRGTTAVVDRVRKGEAAIIVKHGRPLAMLLPFGDLERLRPIELGDADLEPFVGPYRRYRRGREPGGRRR